MAFIGDMFTGGPKAEGVAAAGGNTGGLYNPLEGRNANPYNQASQDALKQYQQFVDQMKAYASGQGPNPAQAQLQQATDKNIAQNAALIGSQKGINPGQAGRLAAENAASIGQQAAGQGAEMRANQMVNAQGQLGNAVAGFTGANQQQQNMFQNAATQFNNSQIAMRGNQNDINQKTRSAANNIGSQIGGNVMSGIGSAFGLAEGGVVPEGYADGGEVDLTKPMNSDGSPTSFAGRFMKGMMGGPSMNPATTATTSPVASGSQMVGKGIGEGAKALAGLFAPKESSDEVASPFAKGGQVKAMVSPGEKYLPAKAAEKVAKSPNKEQEIKKQAQTIPGKAKVKGDSEKNDTVPKTLESGGVVIPRTKANNPKQAADFVAAVMGHKKLGKR